MHKVSHSSIGINNLHFYNHCTHDIYKYKNTNQEYEKQNPLDYDIEFKKLYLTL